MDGQNGNGGNGGPGNGAAIVAEQTPEEFYGADYPRLQAALAQLDGLAEGFAATAGDSDDLKPVVYHTSRIKSPASLVEKIARKGGSGASLADAIATNVQDILGLRIICAFGDDVYAAARWIGEQPNVEVLRTKDYIRHPKPNGYRSYHMNVRFTSGPAAFLPSSEIQIRTVATDFWATLEHKMKYKKTIKNPELLTQELKRCADEIASVDLDMQTLRDAIRRA
jgi:putative GTP pyrophosphokinase